VRIVLTLAGGGQQIARYLLADSGAGSMLAPCELLLQDTDYRACGARPYGTIDLKRAYPGTYDAYMVRVQIPEIGFDNVLAVAGIPNSPTGFQGLACFRFLNRFTYGNFGDPGQFGLQT
jgi:hypothetical protein